ncbi:MAG: hypothetical protein FJ100_09300 [Deltaproteobacteria bacterium]|nr:hypothetical protein [Deltaproteobacteria bacterium]
MSRRRCSDRRMASGDDASRRCNAISAKPTLTFLVPSLSAILSTLFICSRT